MVPKTKRLLMMEGKRCPYCNEMMTFQGDKHRNLRWPTRDHVIPNTLFCNTDTVIVCLKCNYDKGQFTLPFWEAKLRRENDPRAEIVKKFMDDHPESRRIV